MTVSKRLAAQLGAGLDRYAKLSRSASQKKREPIMAELPPEAGTALPEGLRLLPQLGKNAVGAKTRSLVIKTRWGVAGLFLVAALLVATFGYSVVGNSSGGLGFLVVLTLLLAAVSGYHALLARQGASPVLSVDDEFLELYAPFNRVRVRLAAITKVTQLRRDLLVEAPGGIERNGKPTRARWAPIVHARSFEVDRTDLAAYLRSRAGSLIS